MIENIGLVNMSNLVNPPLIEEGNQQFDKIYEKNSCWNLQDPEWIQSAFKFKISDSIYVHYDLLVWLVNFIDNEILSNDWNLRCTVEEIYHHNFDGQVYCIRFYRCLADKSMAAIFNRSYYSSILDVTNKLKYKMLWKSKPTYFLRVDGIFNEKKKALMNAFGRLNLLRLIENTYELNVNWLYIEKVEVYEFSAQTTEQQMALIDNRFSETGKPKASLYITKEFAWHKLHGEFIANVDTLAMDICAEEWRHHNLFNDFNLDEIFQVDMANKDYRDPFYNGYLDGYLKILLQKWYPDILTDNKFEYLVPERNNSLVHYFINQFRSKISSFCVVYKKEIIHYENYDIPFKIPSSSEIILKGVDPDPDILKTLLPQYGSITLILSDYTHFTDSLFCSLLNHSSREQVYAIDFSGEFMFQIPPDVLPIQIVVFPMERRAIVVRIENCNNKNAVKLEQFLEYLIKLFTDLTTYENVELSLLFDTCDCLKDCSVLESLGKVFHYISFAYSNCTTAQLNNLSTSLTKRSKIRFHHCNELHDQIVIQLVTKSDIKIENLYIEGATSCTPIIFFELAEQVMTTEGVNCLKGIKFQNSKYFLPNDKFKSSLSSLEFFRCDDLMQIRNFSNKIIDTYCLINDIPQDEPPPFDYD